MLVKKKIKAKQITREEQKLDEIKQKMLAWESYDREDVKKFLTFQEMLHEKKVANQIV